MCEYKTLGSTCAAMRASMLAWIQHILDYMPSIFVYD